MSRPPELKDFKYELRLLIGADEIITIIEERDHGSVRDEDKFGNIVNYFKDSIYLHSRNLLNALTNQLSTEIGDIPRGIHSELYGKLKKPLERYVTHIDHIRDQKGVTNRINGRPLNDYVHDLTAEVKRCWKEWIDKASDPKHKQELQKHFSAAIKEAGDDAARLRQLIEGRK
ncbi:hypothetical protein H7H78_10240 [Mycobacterium shinjukuense]|uniref:hypothetical protein n=1 Tax=Mycobacterium shinjukuense TaxID=398694 RepID=UPI0011541466|nr:hypothetical protein [Mycobacterium shinjukuense]MCV6985793.1 hypothetical protein [Mycobacterium shinjukuense]